MIFVAFPAPLMASSFIVTQRDSQKDCACAPAMQLRAHAEQSANVSSVHASTSRPVAVSKSKLIRVRRDPRRLTSEQHDQLLSVLCGNSVYAHLSYPTHIHRRQLFSITHILWTENMYICRRRPAVRIFGAKLAPLLGGPARNLVSVRETAYRVCERLLSAVRSTQKGRIHNMIIFTLRRILTSKPKARLLSLFW